MYSKLYCALALLGLAAVSVSATARDWQVDAAHSTLTFRCSYQGEAFDGRFARFDAAIRYDDADLAQAKFDVKIDTASADTRSSERDDSLKDIDFFDIKKFPQAHFVASAFAKNADGSVSAQGTLTIRDQTRPVTLKVKFAPGGASAGPAATATLDVDATLKRLDFGLGSGKDWSAVGADVAVHGHLVLSAK